VQIHEECVVLVIGLQQQENHSSILHLCQPLWAVISILATFCRTDSHSKCSGWGRWAFLWLVNPPSLWPCRSQLMTQICPHCLP